MLPIPIGTDRPQRRLPWMNYAIIAANVFFFAISHASSHTGGMGAGASFAGLAPGWDRFLLKPLDPHVYQFISYQFLHENIGHIFFNMLFLYVFGNNLNEKLGHVAYLLFYLTGGVLAGCGQMLASTAPTLGASGAISAVTGLFLVLLPRTNIRIFMWIIVYVDVWVIPSAYFILFSVVKDILEPLIWGGNGTAYAAHVSGNVAGFLIGLMLLMTRLVQRDHYDLLAMLDRYRRRKQYQALVAGGYQPFTSGGYGGGGGAVARKRGEVAVTPPPPVDPRITKLRDEITLSLKDHQTGEAAAKYLQLRAVDARQALAPQDQLDVANQLMVEQRYGEAAAAYEDYLRLYPREQQQEHIQLVLGVIYARYLPNPARAVELLKAVLPRLHDVRQREMAEAELVQLGVGPDRAAGV
jgi:membrane associated rhomboid family serine protease